MTRNKKEYNTVISIIINAKKERKSKKFLQIVKWHIKRIYIVKIKNEIVATLTTKFYVMLMAYLTGVRKMLKVFVQKSHQLQSKHQTSQRN